MLKNDFPADFLLYLQEGGTLIPIIRRFGCDSLRPSVLSLFLGRNSIKGLLQPRSESDDRAEGDAEVIVRAVVEVDFVTEFETEAYRAESWLQATCRIE